MSPRKEPCANCGADKHTAIPWHAEPEEASGGRGIAICSVNGDIVATVTPDHEGYADAIDWANAGLMTRGANFHEDLVAAYEKVEGGFLDVLHALNDAGLPCPASLGLAMEKLREIIASCSKKTDKLVNAEPSAPAGRDSSTPAERQAFTERVCKPRGWDRYDSCVDSPCPYSGVGGCRHPEHPSNKKTV